jgi:hypothetical protein
MKCPACGREMVNKGMYFDCPNILCDYEEEIENDWQRVPALLSGHEIPTIARATK